MGEAFCCELKTSLKSKALKTIPKVVIDALHDLPLPLPPFLCRPPPLPPRGTAPAVFIPGLHSDILPPGNKVCCADALKRLTQT